MLDAEKEDRNKPQKRKGALANLVARCEKLAAGDDRFDPTEALGRLQLRKPPPKPKEQKSDDKPRRVRTLNDETIVFNDHEIGSLELHEDHKMRIRLPEWDPAMPVAAYDDLADAFMSHMRGWFDACRPEV